jgi:hypothetical protein
VKRVPVALIVFFLIPLAAAAQTTVAVMPFTGNDPDITVREVEAQEGFTPQDIAADSTGFRPAEPPDPALLEGLPYVLAGEYYLDIEGMYHFQQWLRNSTSGGLVCTADEGL